METINIKGKQYVTVNERLKAFRTEQAYAGWSLKTIAHELTGEVCVMEAQILDKDGRLRANGFAREVRTQAGSMVNATSYVENCETSAWGRALGNLGIGIDESICSAQEFLVAIGMQESKPAAPAKAAPAAPVSVKGNVIRPNDQKPVEPPKNAVDEDEFQGLLADIDCVPTYQDLIQLMKSDRVQKSPYKEALLRAGHNFAERKGWEKKQ